MLQRIQSLLLLIAAGLHISMFFITLWTADIKAPNGEDKLLKMNIYEVITYSKDQNSVIEKNLQIIPLIGNIILIALAIVTIFLYSNRILQNKLCRLLILIETGLVVFLVFAFDKVKDSIVAKSFTSEYNYLGIALPILALILFFIAGRTIMKDEKKVRSLDRLR